MWSMIYEKMHLRERMEVVSRWYEMCSCLSIGGMMGGYHVPELMEHFQRSVVHYEQAIEKLREKTTKNQ